MWPPTRSQRSHNYNEGILLVLLMVCNDIICYHTGGGLQQRITVVSVRNMNSSTYTHSSTYTSLTLRAAVRLSRDTS